MTNFIINKGFDDEQKVEGASRYYTQGEFIDFVHDANGQQILRIKASRVETIAEERS